MPSILSKQLVDKILGREWSFGYNCYEVGHTWTPSCTSAALEVSTAATVKIIPLYAALYAFSQVAVQQKFDKSATLDTVKSILRSSFFIFFHAYQGQMLGCALRKGFGRFYYRVLVCAPALLSSYLSLLIEKPARRQALAFYLLNMASEIVFRMLVTKGYFKPINHGETLLFALSLAVWYRLLKMHGFGHDPVSAVVKVLIGRDEAKSRSRHKNDNNVIKQKNEHQDNSSTNHCRSIVAGRLDKAVNCKSTMSNNNNKISLSVDKLTKMLAQAPAQCAKFIDYLGMQWFGGKQMCCPHANESTCFEYVIKPIPSRFLIGYAIQVILKLSSNPLAVVQNPRQAFVASLKSPASVRFGLFLVTLVSGGRLTSCLLRSYSKSNDLAWHGAVSGFVAGLSMFWAPRSSISMYIMWKAVEQYYLLAARQGKAPYFNFTIMTIYSASAATILYTFALEPRFVRPSYMKFLDNMSDHRLHQLNRMVLDVFGTGSSIGYEDYFPDLDPKYMSNQFKELIFNWMIQPYE